MKKTRIRFPAKAITAILAVLLGLFALRAFLVSLSGIDYFKIKEVIVHSPYPVDVSYLKSRNIFSVNLNKEAEHLLLLHPDLQRVKIVRILPDKLFVDFIKRVPLAFVKLYRYFCVDADSVFFECPAVPLQQPLPVIIGLDTKIFGVKPGKKYNISELWFALSIIREIGNSRNLRQCQIKNIDVSNSANTKIYLSLGPANEPFEVRIGQGQIADKVNILGSLIIQENSDRFNIKYIDLRFKEPVIKLKDAKK